MSTQNYAVYAFSPSLNQQVRRFDLANINQVITEQQAEQDAEFFAQLNNTNQYLNVTDWQARVQLELHGIDTMPGWIDGVTRQV